jgi:hypothetical protein
MLTVTNPESIRDIKITRRWRRRILLLLFLWHANLQSQCNARKGVHSWMNEEEEEEEEPRHLHKDGRIILNQRIIRTRHRRSFYRILQLDLDFEEFKYSLV